MRQEPDCFHSSVQRVFSAGDASKWTVKKIMWLMVQVWFGSTYLSFAEVSLWHLCAAFEVDRIPCVQAESFHQVFGPILMTGFAALSNSLLITSEYFVETAILVDLTSCSLVLISVLSNTYARIAAVRAFLNFFVFTTNLTLRRMQTRSTCSNLRSQLSKGKRHTHPFALPPN